jgi:hypothetical protein
VTSTATDLVPPGTWQAPQVKAIRSSWKDARLALGLRELKAAEGKLLSLSAASKDQSVSRTKTG